jgi:DNA-binding LacI/PurR family transcriptional regulator
VILLDREVIGFYSHYIGVDNVDIGYRAALHLIARGHKRVGFAYTAGQISTDRGRLSGYRMAVEEAGLRGVEITIRENIHRSLESFKSSSRLFGDQIQQIADRPTAWVCSSDKEAVALMDHFGSAGLAVPADVAVVGCDHDLFLLHDKHYELTTFEYPYAQIAREILFLYSSLLRDEQVPFRKTEFRAELVPGQTS